MTGEPRKLSFRCGELCLDALTLELFEVVAVVVVAIGDVAQAVLAPKRARSAEKVLDRRNEEEEASFPRLHELRENVFSRVGASDQNFENSLTLLLVLRTEAVRLIVAVLDGAVWILTLARDPLNLAAR